MLWREVYIWHLIFCNLRLDDLDNMDAVHIRMFRFEAVRTFFHGGTADFIMRRIVKASTVGPILTLSYRSKVILTSF